jgi:PIN like domain
MPPDRKNLRFYFDESLLGVGKALAMARRDTIHVGHPLIETDFPLGALDTDWLPKVAARDWITFLRDRRIRTKPAELLAFRDHRVRAFWVAGKKDLSVWSTLVRLVNRWPDIERIVAGRGPGPWFMAINEDRVAEIALPAEDRARPERELHDLDQGSAG